jgi:hypothetical protein
MNFWNEDKIAWAGLPEKVKRGIESVPRERLNENGVWEPWTGEYEANGVYRSTYDWLGNPEKRPLRDNEPMRRTYEDARIQGNLEFWFRGVWLEDRLAGDDPTLDNVFAYRIKPVDTSNPDCIAWCKLDERVKDAIRQSDRVQTLNLNGKWIDWRHKVFDDGVAFRIAP